MRISLSIGIVGVALLASVAMSANATIIDFTGGTVYQLGGGTAVTDTTTTYDDVDYYEQDGVRFDFIGPAGEPFSYLTGNYYGVGNDVIHGHWVDGLIGDMESIRVEKIDSTAFDLNYFKITSNTDNPGLGPPIGTVEIYINALADGSTVSYSMLLPSDDWGFAGSNPEIYLGTEFDGIKAFTFTYGSGAVGFGLDEFYIDEAAPVIVPEPSTTLLVGFGLAAISATRRLGRIRSKRIGKTSCVFSTSENRH